MGRQYPTSQSNNVDIFSVQDYYTDENPANSYKQQNKHMEIAHHLHGLLGMAYGMTPVLIVVAYLQ